MRHILILGIWFSSSALHMLQGQVVATANQTGTGPVIDGIISANEWDNATVFDFQGTNGLENVGESANWGAGDFSGTFRVMWDSTNLYLLFEITDDSRVWDNGYVNDKYNDDSLEVYLDLTDSGGTSLNSSNGIFQYRFGMDNGTNDGGVSSYGNWLEPYPDNADFTGFAGGAIGSTLPDQFPDNTGIDYAYTNTTYPSFIMEIIIPWSTPNGDNLGTDFVPSIGESLGFTLVYNDDDYSGGSRDSQHFWVANDANAWNDATQWGTLQLAAVPEPEEISLLIGFIAFGLVIWRRKN